MVDAAPVILREVSDRRTLRRYIHLPEKLYREYENWVPPIYADEWRSNDSRHNPALTRARGKGAWSRETRRWNRKRPTRLPIGS